jgi:tetratricopeptide (TPR) repeat protein
MSIEGKFTAMTDGGAQFACEGADGPAQRALLQRLGWAPIVLFSVSLALRLGYLAALRGDPILVRVQGLDTRVYLARAAEIAEGDWFGAGPLFHSGFLYPYALAAVGGSTLAMTLLQALAGAVCSLLLYLLGARLVSRPCGLVAGGLHATSGVFVFASGTVLFDPWVSFFVLVGLLCVLEASRRAQRFRWWFSAGVALSVAATAKPFILLFFPLVLLGWLAPSVRASRRDQSGAALALIAGAAVVFGPVSLRNLLATGDVSPFPATGGFAFYLGNNPSADGTLVVPTHLGVWNSIQAYASSTLAYPSRRLGRPVGSSEASLFWFREGLRFWEEAPGSVARLTLRKVALLFNAHEVGDNYVYGSFRARVGLLRWLPDHTAILALGVLGLLAGARRWDRLGPPLLMAGTFVAILPLFWMSSRFRYPLVALLCLFAGLAVVEWLRWVLERRWIAAAAGSSAAVVLALATHAPLGVLDRQPTGAVQLAEAHLAVGDWSSALREARGGLEHRPTARLRVLEARALARLGRDDEALAALRRATSLAPRSDDAQVLMEEIASSREDPEEALLVRAVSQDASSLASQIALVKYYLDSGRFIRAVEEAQRAVDLDPLAGEPVFLLAAAYGLRGMPARSIELYEVLERRAPGNPSVLANLAFAYLDEGRYREAEGAFEEVLRVDANNRLADYGMGLLHKFAGRFDRSRFHFERFLEKEPPESHWARRARANLEELDR